MQHEESVSTKPAFSEKLDELVTLARRMEDRFQELFSIPDDYVRDLSFSRSRSSSEIN